jgi:hypothetical protein
MNKYIIINLNQTINKAQIAEIKAERKRWISFSLLSIVFIGIIVVMFYVNDGFQNLVESRKQTIAKIMSDTDKLAEDSQIDLSKSDIKSMYKLEDSRILWAPKLESLSNLLPDEMAITELNYHNNKLVISAISKLHEGEKEFKVIDNFISLLKSDSTFSKGFKTITFMNTQRMTSRGNEILSFNIIGDFKSSKIKRK